MVDAVAEIFLEDYQLVYRKGITREIQNPKR
jgi:hypothetical protein